MNRETEIPPIAPGLFSLPPGQGEPNLLGGYCAACDRRFFPRPKYCPVCLEPASEEGLGSRGTLYSYTVVRTRPPLGLPQPYGVGYVDLAGSGLRIFCLLDPDAIERYRIGLPVRLAVDVLGHDGRGAPRLRPYFTPVGQEEEGPQ
ncbi:MAG: OB-fold domain-containing protein [Deltaproteobacteria bacterium]|nr:OB-fold domain-containing protein [Deltaproteobacteria bacterium]